MEKFGNKKQDLEQPRQIVLTIARILLGLDFMWHGVNKLAFVSNWGSTIAMFKHFGIPIPEISAAIVILVEFFGGLALVIGAFVPLACVILIIDMVGAVIYVHIHNGFSMKHFGLEIPLIFTIALLAIGVSNYGKFGLDNALCDKFCKTRK